MELTTRIEWLREILYEGDLNNQFHDLSGLNKFLEGSGLTTMLITETVVLAEDLKIGQYKQVLNISATEYQPKFCHIEGLIGPPSNTVHRHGVLNLPNPRDGINHRFSENQTGLSID